MDHSDACSIFPVFYGNPNREFNDINVALV